MRKLLAILFLILAVQSQGLGSSNQKPMRGSTLITTDPFSRGLVGYWLLNERVGATVFDLSGNQNHGNLYDGVGSALPTWGPDGLVFADTEYEAVDCGSRTSVLPNAWTFVARINATDASANTLFGWASGASEYSQFQLRYGGGDPLLYLGSGNFSFFSTYPKFGQWATVAVTCPGAGQNDVLTSQFYVDGIPLSRGSTANSSAQDAKVTFHIGHQGQAGGSKDYEGKIAWAMLYDRVLSQSEVVQISFSPFRIVNARGRIPIMASELPQTNYKPINGVIDWPINGEIQ